MKLSDYLKQHDMTQVEFARKVGLTHGTISKYINGKMGMTRETLARIVAATNGLVQANDLYASHCEAAAWTAASEVRAQPP